MIENPIMTSDTSIREYIINGCTYEIEVVFGEKIKLEEILAHRIIQELEAETHEKHATTACLST